MLLKELKSLISKHPRSRDACNAFISFINSNQSKVYSYKFTLGRLLDKLDLPNNYESLEIVELLISNKILDKKIQVQSESGGGIGSFNSFSDVPNIIYDQFKGEEVLVSTENIVTIFTIHNFDNVH